MLLTKEKLESFSENRMTACNNHGGRRSNAGRKKGGSNRDTRMRRRRIEIVAEKIATQLVLKVKVAFVVTRMNI